MRVRSAGQLHNLTTWQDWAFIERMQAFTIGEFKAKLSDILERVSRGESVILQKGRKKQNVAILSPFQPSSQKPRKLGPLSKRGKPVFKNWEMSEDEFLSAK